MSAGCMVKILIDITATTFLVFGFFVFTANVSAELFLQPRSYMYSDDRTQTAYSCVSGSYLNFTATSQTDCCLTCLTNAQMNCLAGNYYPTDGRCEIFEVWTEASPKNVLPICTSFRKIEICPKGFKYLPLIKTCLLLNPSREFTWDSGLKYCSALRSNTSMVMVESTLKATEVMTFINSISSDCQGKLTWTGASRLNRLSTSGEFYWFGPNNLTTLATGVPLFPSSCLSFYQTKPYLIGANCSSTLCVVCETAANI